MKRTLIVFFVVALFGVMHVQAKAEVTPARFTPTPTAVPWIENDTFILGGQVSDWVTVCKDTGVYGNPYGIGEVLYSVFVGDVVRVHDTSKDNTWIMIKSAQWIPISTVCDW